MNTKYYPLFAFLAAVLLVGIFIVLLILGLRPTEQKTQNLTPQISYSPAQEEKILREITFSALPNPAILLQANTTPTLTIHASRSISPSSLTVRLSEKSFGAESFTEVTAVTIDQSTDSDITITPTNPLTANTYYTLSLMQKSTNTLIYSVSYQTNTPLPTAVPLTSNNQKTLSAYLPEETASYSLTYNKLRNVYTFHFIFQPEKPGSLESQFEQAKSDAVTFINSIGVDPNSITIEWKHS